MKLVMDINIDDGTPDEGNIDETPTKLGKCDRGWPQTWATLNSHIKFDRCGSERPDEGNYRCNRTVTSQ